MEAMRCLQDFFSSPSMSLAQNRMRARRRCTKRWLQTILFLLGSHTKHSSVLPVSPLAAPCPASSMVAGRLMDALHHLKGTLWCRIIQRSRSPVWKPPLPFPHQHRCNLMTNTAWHQFSQISPKYSTLALNTRGMKKGYCLWPCVETLHLPFPWTPWQYTFGFIFPPLPPSFPDVHFRTEAKPSNWYKPHLDGIVCPPFSMYIFCSSGHPIFSETRFWWQLCCLEC